MTENIKEIKDNIINMIIKLTNEKPLEILINAVSDEERLNEKFIQVLKMMFPIDHVFQEGGWSKVFMKDKNVYKKNIFLLSSRMNGDFRLCENLGPEYRTLVDVCDTHSLSEAICLATHLINEVISKEK